MPETSPVPDPPQGAVAPRGAAMTDERIRGFVEYCFPMTNLCRVLVVDDDPMVREAYRMFLARHNDHEVVGEARNGREAGGGL